MFEKIGTEIVSEGIFERFPKLKPYVGVNYDNSNKHRKLLLITESNYDDEATNAEMWYKNAAKESLILPEKFCSCGKISYLTPLFGKIINLLKLEPYKEDNKDKYKDNDVANYNYFLRPALNNGKGKDKGFKAVYENIDGEVAFSAFCGIIEVIKPDIVIFASSFAYDKWTYFKKYNVPRFSDSELRQKSFNFAI